MKIFGIKDEGLKPEDAVPVELAEINLIANAQELRKIANFILDDAEGMDKGGKSRDHEHLSDKFREFESSPHFAVLNPDT